MNDNTVQNPQTNNTYVDDYQPPAQVSDPVNPPTQDIPETPAEPVNSGFTPEPVNSGFEPEKKSEQITEPAMPVVTTDVADDAASVDEPAMPVATDEQAMPMETSDFSNSDSETLEDQNIFFMLGVEDGSDEVKENFLNELQKVIWDDFLENDVNLLITSEEKVKFDELIAKKELSEKQGLTEEASEEIQDALVTYLESLIPDLEDIMLEKALDLKSDLYVERINGLRDYYANDSAMLEKISESEKLMSEEKWYSSAALLNGFGIQ